MRIPHINEKSQVTSLAHATLIEHFAMSYGKVPTHNNMLLIRIFQLYDDDINNKASKTKCHSAPLLTSPFKHTKKSNKPSMSNERVCQKMELKTVTLCWPSIYKWKQCSVLYHKNEWQWWTCVTKILSCCLFYFIFYFESMRLFVCVTIVTVDAVVNEY